MQFGIVAAIGVDDFGLLKWSATHAANGWNRVDERQQLGDVVSVRAGQDRADGDSVGVDEDVVLGAWSRAIRGVRTRLSPAPTARIDDESTAAREKSSWLWRGFLYGKRAAVGAPCLPPTRALQRASRRAHGVGNKVLQEL